MLNVRVKEVAINLWLENYYMGWMFMCTHGGGNGRWSVSPQRHLLPVLKEETTVYTDLSPVFSFTFTSRNICDKQSKSYEILDEVHRSCKLQ